MAPTKNTHPDTTTEWMTVEDLTSYIGLSKSSIHKQCCAGKLPFYKMSKKLLFNRAEIDALIHSTRNVKDQAKTQLLTSKPKP